MTANNTLNFQLHVMDSREIKRLEELLARLLFQLHVMDSGLVLETFQLHAVSAFQLHVMDSRYKEA